MAEPLERAWTVDEFFAWQERQTERYELVRGRPLRMMAGAKNVHDNIVMNIVMALGPQVRAKGCWPFGGDGAVETFPGQIRRPDFGVDCGERDQEAYKAAAPRLVAEVLSPTTRDFDSVGKLFEYKFIASLDYILYVEPNQPDIRVWSRGADRAWVESRIEGLEATVELAALNVALPLAAVYDGVEFPREPSKRLSIER